MITPEYEYYLIDTVLPQLSEGRPGWDRPHTELVVSFVKKIIKENTVLELDLDVLVVVAYLHDYGYMFFRDSLQPGPTGSLSDAKLQHADKSAEYWIEIRENTVFDVFSEEQKQRIEHLIRVHDFWDTLRDKDELVFMEADTLGALTMESNIDSKSKKYQDYVNRVEKNRVSRFVTNYSREVARVTIERLRG